MVTVVDGRTANHLVDKGAVSIWLPTEDVAARPLARIDPAEGREALGAQRVERDVVEAPPHLERRVAISGNQW